MNKKDKKPAGVQCSPRGAADSKHGKTRLPEASPKKRDPNPEVVEIGRKVIDDHRAIWEELAKY